MSSVHAVRAKQWETNAFLAEWFANAAAYCKTKEGKKDFESWLIKEYGRKEAQVKLLSCQKPPCKKYGQATGNVKLFNSAAVELGISDEAMQLYHLFTSSGNICVPPRTKPAPKRRRGEPPSEWLARRHDALLNGCKVPDVDWRIARALAISEFDKAKDTFEMWHNDIEFFVERILPRAPSTLIDQQRIGRPGIHGKVEEAIYQMEYAFTSSLHAVTLSYMTWGHAVDVFEELDRRGLVSTSAIERAYKQDSALMWRLVAILCRISYLDGHLWERFTEVMSWCEYYRPFFKRFRTPGGSSRVEVNRPYLKQRGGYPTFLDNVIIEAIDTDANLQVAFFDNVLKCLKENPAEAAKFSSEAYQEMGDVAIVQQFKAEMTDSAFGRRLWDYAASKDEQRLMDPNFLSTSTFMDPSKIHWVSRNSNDWVYARTISRSLGNTWLAITNQMSMAPFFMYCIDFPTRKEDLHLLPRAFDDAWLKIDTALWQYASALDRKGEPGTVAMKFGLFDPTDPDRVTSLDTMLKHIRSKKADREPAAIPPLPSTQNIHREAARPPAAMSGHTYMVETKNMGAKEKVKTKGAASASTEETTGRDVGGDEEEEDEILPDALPNTFKLGKKVLKVFHLILRPPDDASQISGDKNEAAGRNKGQVRWAEFERAMKRIGFTVCQTAGSSVRFDPPAKTAHPITFHRPHPDAVLTPILLRWMGARLKRCYGWTTATFERLAEGDE